MALEEYKSKRDFRQTSEPQARKAKPNRQPIFVVQEHHASRLHYDFRLEADGVLKSWAVPKEPSMDPAQKRLAIHVEDHPLQYANFEGTIPEGQYGAGTVSIWDSGTYDKLRDEESTPQSASEGIDSGRLEFELHGRKLKGRFALIRMRGRGRGKENWLLIKMKDAQARPASSKSRNGQSSQPRRKPAARLRAAKLPPAGGVSFSHLSKVMYPEAGLTKGDVVEFYRQIAPRLLPFLRDRPATLERLPNGLGNGRATHFWQKNIPSSYPEWIPRAELPTEQGKTVHYALVNDVETLLFLVNQGTLTFHVWFSRMEDLDHPDFVLFDLDPGKASFGEVVDIANKLHTVLDAEGVDSFVKTSGKTGLHVLVPWQSDGGYDEARDWALGIAERLVEDNPDQATVERSKAKRGDRVYIDVIQNARGHHAVPPYVLRAVPQATVSTPLDWREVNARLDPTDFTLKTISRRLKQVKHDPIAKFLAFLDQPKMRSK